MYCTSTLKSWQRFALLASLFAILTNNFNAFGEGKKSEPVKRDKATKIKTSRRLSTLLFSLVRTARSITFSVRTFPRKARLFRTCCRKASLMLTERRALTFRWRSSLKR